ncbi:hypothetical protein K1T35_47945 (plasmid) [Pseudonocardia sp. DSM 110487]|uniref:hypothetical protein n=1 Tax=Pseudonocardia sp. DSM 110487 TaxID=2865833 RepID=UPI001C6A00F4|nr:hypothetical protein [Pseudonocardia sp. DSM 110487]QYN41084.1 hypothetical protein K1T35_47945 [Pseudonocardia sp. DSM 110487]
MADPLTGPRFVVEPAKGEDVSRLPDIEFSAGTYGAAADAVAEARQCVERVASALQEGDI